MPHVLKYANKTYFEMIMGLGYVTHLVLPTGSSFPEVNDVHLVPVVSFKNIFNTSKVHSPLLILIYSNSNYFINSFLKCIVQNLPIVSYE